MGEEFEYLKRGENLEYWFPIDSNPELNHFLPDYESLPEGVVEGDEKVPKEYTISQSIISSAIEDQEIQEFKQENFENVRCVGQHLDEIKYDLDNNEEMQRSEIENRLILAYQEIEDTKERTDSFSPDNTKITYTEETKELFLDYLKEIEQRIKSLSKQNNIDLEENSELDPEPVNVHSLLEPSNTDRGSGSVEMNKPAETRAKAAD